MSNKSYLDLDGLQYYDDKWKLEFENMAIDDEDMDSILCETLGIIPSTPPTRIKFGINTEASGSGMRTAGIPFNLYGQDITLTVDWGDGTTSTLTSADYTEINSRASVHTYAQPGEYSIKVSSSDWSQTYILTYPRWNDEYAVNSDSYDCVAPLYWMRKTLTSIPSVLPTIAGTNAYTNPLQYIDEDSEDILWEHTTWFSGLFSECTKLTSIPVTLFQYNTDKTEASYEYVFYGCTGLTSIPEGLFDNLDVHDLQGCFSGCTGLTSIPEGLFARTTDLFSVENCFSGCTSLGDFTLRISATGCSRASNFVSKDSETVRTIYVPAGSTTETTFNGVASSLGLTVIGS